jgi:tetratricopeptide (TPR) repeat protein
VLLRGFWIVVDFQRIRRQQALREAEGYLELTMGFADQCPVAPEIRVRLAQRALEALRRVPCAAGQRAQALYLTGLAYRAMQRYGEALPPLKAAAKLNPDDILIWLALGWCYKRTGRLDYAIESLEQALAVDESEAILHYNLACYWSLAGNAERAIRYLARAFDIDSTYRSLVAEESDFDPIRHLPEFQALMGAIV